LIQRFSMSATFAQVATEEFIRTAFKAS